MIARAWRGIASFETANAYIHHLKNDTFPLLRKIKGYIEVKLMRKDTKDGVEFMVMTIWDSMEAIEAFAGEDIEKAVVPPKAQALLISYDPIVEHFGIDGT